MMEGIFALVAGVVVGGIVWEIVQRWRGLDLRSQSAAIMQKAQQEKERVLQAAEVKAKAEMLKMQDAQEKEGQKRRDELASQEKQLRQKDSALQQLGSELIAKESDLKKRENDIVQQEKVSREQRQTAEESLQKALTELERVAKLSREQAKDELVARVVDDARRLAGEQVARIEENTRKEALERAQKIVASAVQRLASDFVAEHTVSVVELPSDDMKGRIIGREGRNIRAIESATGVDVIIDDTPEAIIVSGFNPIRREIAKLAIGRLVTDGRIHPARIEEVVDNVSQEMEQNILRFGEQAVLDVGLHGIHPELMRLIGKLKFRVVGGQNVLHHSVETAFVAGMLAGELGVNPINAKRAGLLHDIGRAVDHESDGTHAEVAAEVARKFGERQEVADALLQHHDDNPQSLLAVIVQTADVVSKARPGARREQVQTYLKRLYDLEKIAQSFKGVDKAYAIAAGREIRVVVNFEEVSQHETILLANDIARRVQEELTYPGEVRVTVIREARASDIAR